MLMPTPDAKTIANRPAIVERLQQIVPKGAFGDNVIADPAGLRAYECDGLSAYRQLPLVVVLPENTSQISKILEYCNQTGVKVVAGVVRCSDGESSLDFTIFFP